LLRSLWPWLVSAAALALGVRVVQTAPYPLDHDWQQASEALFDDRNDAAVHHARQALSRRPLDGRPYAVLGRVALQRGEVAQAQQLSALAVRHAARHVPSLLLDGEMALERRDYMDAVGRYDRLLRVFPGAAPTVMPVLMQLALDADARSEMVARLATAPRPPWREEYLRWHATRVDTLGALDDLFVPLADRGGLSPREIGYYLERYVRAGDVAGGQRIWRLLLPSPVRQRDATPYNGDFEERASVGGPYEWQLDTLPGVEAALRPPPGREGKALRVGFTGRRAAFRHVRQLLALPPGRYQMHWESRFDRLETPQGLRWTLVCSHGPAREALLATPPRRGNRRWGSEEAQFEVPAGCPGQWLTLELYARIPAETQARGSAWFDGLRIEPQRAATR
jgi:hypothetical protein